MRPAAEGAAEFMRESDQDLDRCWAGFDGTSVVATLRSFATPLTLPGGAMVPTAALTSVTTKATHRRQGLLTRMITPDLDNAAERGEVAGILIAAEWPIYGRFGYGNAADSCQLKLDVPRTRFLREATGTVEMVDAATARRECPAVYDRYQAAQPGAIERDGRWWDIATRIKAIPGFPLPERFWVLCRDKRGKVVGYVSYAVDDHWVDRRPENTATLGELIGVDEEATLRLWQYLAQIDWVQTITASDRSVDDPLHWQLHDALGAARPTSGATSCGCDPSTCPGCSRPAGIPSSSVSSSRSLTTWGGQPDASRSTAGLMARPATRADASRPHVLGVVARRAVARRRERRDPGARRAGRRAPSRSRGAGRRLLPLAGHALVQHLVLTLGSDTWVLTPGSDQPYAARMAPAERPLLQPPVIKPIDGRLGVLTVGMGAVASTLVAGVELAKRGMGEPIGSLTQMGTIRLGKRTEHRVPLIKDFVPLAVARRPRLRRLGPVPRRRLRGRAARGRARRAAATSSRSPRPLRAVRPMKAAFDPAYVKRLDGAEREGRREQAGDARGHPRGHQHVPRASTSCDRVVMVWCGSTEIFLEPGAAHIDLDAFEAAIDADDPTIAPSMLYA